MLKSKSLRYLTNAMNICYIRKSSLIHQWVNATDEIRKARLWIILNKLEDRLSSISHSYYLQKEALNYQRAVEDETIIILTCEYFECKYSEVASGAMVRYADYEPGKLTCITCGDELVPEGQKNLEEFLHDNNIRLD